MDTATTTRRVGREARKPFGSHVQKLSYPERPGFHRHWFNNTPGRLESALAAGYTHVEDKEGRKVQRPVGVDDAGQVLLGFLMEIPEEWFQEDMAAQQKNVDEMVSAIRSGAVAGSPGQDGRYIPATRGIKIESGRGK